MPKISECKLSEMFCNEEGEDPGTPALELIVKVVNINGYEDRPGNCRQLYEYEWFVETVRKYQEEEGIDSAAERALNEMPEDFTIRDFLLENREEVTLMSIYEYNKAEQRKFMYEEGKEDGRAEGRVEGLAEGCAIQTTRNVNNLMESLQVTFEEACHLLKLSETEIGAIREYS